MRLLPHTALALLGCSLLTACGGGGGGGDSVFGDYNIAAAWDNLLTDARTVSASGRDTLGNDHVLTLTFTPLAAAPYPRSPTLDPVPLRTQQFSSDVVNNTTTFSETIALHYSAGARLVGASVAGGGCSDVTMGPALPTATPVGSSGPLYTSTDYATCMPGAALTGTGTTTWSIEADNGTVYACVNSVQRAPGGAVEGTESDCVQVASNGNLGARVRITIAIPGVSLVARGG